MLVLLTDVHNVEANRHFVVITINPVQTGYKPLENIILSINNLKEEDNNSIEAVTNRILNEAFLMDEVFKKMIKKNYMNMTIMKEK